jgi:hypothetical protein
MHIFAGGDNHSGSQVGLTPPPWHQKDNPEHSEMWERFKKMVLPHKPFDVAIWNADLIDGKSKRTGSTDVITADRREQAKMATYTIKYVGAPVNLITYGTGYHVGQGEDWEDVIADYVNAVDGMEAIIKSHHFVEIGGVTFSIKHKVGSSTIPHGVFTPLAKEKLWDRIWAEEKKQHPNSQVLIRSHVHDHKYCGKKGPDWWLAMTLPALQGLGSKYGARQCSKTVDWGFCWFEIGNGKIQEWDAEIFELETQKDEIISFA